MPGAPAISCIWNQDGQKYVPQDADQMMFYKETKDGQILQEGTNSAAEVGNACLCLCNRFYFLENTGIGNIQRFIKGLRAVCPQGAVDVLRFSGAAEL